MKNYAHEYCARYTYVCNINNGSNCYLFSLKQNWCIYKYKYLINYHYSWQTRPAKMLNVKIEYLDLSFIKASYLERDLL